MVKKHTRFAMWLILLAALPATAQAQDLTTVINYVVKAMGSENVRTLHFSGSGSSYTSGKDATYVKSYIRDIDLNAPSSRMQVVRVPGPTPAEIKESQNVTANDAWPKQFELWTNPWTFLKGAIANKGTVSTETIFAQKYTVVTFMVQGRYKVSGFINDQNLIEKIQTWIDPNDTPVETTYREYMDFNGLKFPTMIIEKHAGELALIVLVGDVKTNVPLN